MARITVTFEYDPEYLEKEGLTFEGELGWLKDSNIKTISIKEVGEDQNKINIDRNIETIIDIDNDVFTSINWSIEDLKESMKKNKIIPTEKNIEAFLNSSSPSTLEDVSVQYGWNAIDDLITMIEFPEK